MGVDFRSRHFAFRGAELGLLGASSCGVSTLPLSPAGVYVPSTPTNRFLKLFWRSTVGEKHFFPFL
jgi:hypothetical protein